MFQNALLQAQETMQLASKSREQMEAEIAQGKNPYADPGSPCPRAMTGIVQMRDRWQRCGDREEIGRDLEWRQRHSGSVVRPAGQGSRYSSSPGISSKAGYNINMNRPITAAVLSPASATRLSRGLEHAS